MANAAPTVTRESNKKGEGQVKVTLQIPQTTIPMGIVMPIDAQEDHELMDLLDEWRVARAERECLDDNIKVLDAALQKLRQEQEQSVEREHSKRGAFESYLDKNLKKEKPK